MRAVVILGALAACTSASPDPGVGAPLRVQGAQYRPGPFPADEGGPAALSVLTKHSELVIGRLDEPVRGVVDPAARGVVLGIEGHDGTWLLPAGPPDIDSGTNATAKATIGLSEAFEPGELTLLLAASDASGRFGAPASQALIADAIPEPMGELVIGLTWSSRADLDLHVVDPKGGEAYSRDPNTIPAPVPGEPVDPEAYKAGGILDHDGNKDCHGDQSPNEHVIWQMPPPDGAYIARVDIRNACGDASTTWNVTASRSGTEFAHVRGESTPGEAQLPHDYGAGVLALQFTCDASGCR